MKTVFVVFRRDFGQPDFPDKFVCVRRTFEKAATEAHQIKPAVVLEMATAPDAEPQQLNRCEFS